MDKDGDGFLNLREFMTGMLCIFNESYESLVSFIFQIYDFDRDGYIEKEDVQVVLSHLNLKKKDQEQKIEIEKYYHFT